jgi:hypothetical protein
MLTISLEAISKIEKWFEVKPPAPLSARRVGPTPRRGRRRIVTAGIYINILRITIQAGRTEIGPFDIFEMASIKLRTHSP